MRTVSVSNKRLVLTRRGCESEAISHFYESYRAERSVNKKASVFTEAF